MKHCHRLHPAELVKVRPIGSSSTPMYRLFLICLVTLFGFSHLALAQVETADILGRVSDATHAVVQGAQVTVTNLDTGVSHKQTSNNAGEFVVSALPIGRYSVSIQSPGFETYSIPTITLSEGDRTRVDATLKVGEALNVEVGTAEPSLQTDSSVVGVVVTEREVEDLPLDGRNFMQLAQILAGTKARPTRSPAAAARTIAGLRPRSPPTARTKTQTTSLSTASTTTSASSAPSASVPIQTPLRSFVSRPTCTQPRLEELPARSSTSSPRPEPTHTTVASMSSSATTSPTPPTTSPSPTPNCARTSTAPRSALR
jgi:hypothetical protein